MEIKDSAFVFVRALFAEYAVAAWREAQGGNPVLRGGRTRGYDVVDTDMLIDAKVLVALETPQDGCDWQLRRVYHELFDPTKTTHIALVILPRDMGFDLSADGDRITGALRSAGPRFISRRSMRSTICWIPWLPRRTTRTGTSCCWTTTGLPPAASSSGLLSCVGSRSDVYSSSAALG